MVHWPSPDDSRFILSSVSPPSFSRNNSGKISVISVSYQWFVHCPFKKLKTSLNWKQTVMPDVSDFVHALNVATHIQLGMSSLIYTLFFTPAATEVNDLESGADPDFSDYTKVSYWEELPCGLYSIRLKDLDNSATCMKEGCVVEVRKHDWTDSSLHTLIRWERKSTVPIVDGLIPDTSSVDKGSHHLSPSFRNSSEAEDSISNGLEKRDLPSDICLSPGNCITQSGAADVC